MKVILLLAICIIVCGCVDNLTLPDFIRLPFEGSGQPGQPGQTIILEVEGACDGYETGARWISCYEDEVAPISTLLGTGHGPDGMASTDSRPCLRYEIQPEFVDDFMLAVVECAIETRMWSVHFNRQTGLVDGEPEFECVFLWEEGR